MFKKKKLGCISFLFFFFFVVQISKLEILLEKCCWFLIFLKIYNKDMFSSSHHAITGMFLLRYQKQWWLVLKISFFFLGGGCRPPPMDGLDVIHVLTLGDGAGSRVGLLYLLQLAVTPVVASPPS